MILWNLPNYLELRSFIQGEISSRRHVFLDKTSLDFSGIPSVLYLKSRNSIFSDLVLGLQNRNRFN